MPGRKRTNGNKKKANASIQQEEVPALSKIDPNHAHVDAQSPLSLKEEGAKAYKMGQMERACHMWTLAMDMLLTSNDDDAKGKSLFEIDLLHKGLLHQLLSNRALVHTKTCDYAAAIDDAEKCCQAAPGFEKGHLRLLDAMVGLGASKEERRAACRRAVNACPTSKELEDLMDELSGGPADDNAAADAEVAAQVEATKKIADDAKDPRCAMAAGDLGSLYAVGAHGLAQDLALAERYLGIGAAGGDAASQRNLGLLLLDTGRHAQGADSLRQAAAQGDEEAQRVLSQVGEEAKQKALEAKMQLGLLASQGDQRAAQLLQELQQQGLV